MKRHLDCFKNKAFVKTFTIAFLLLTASLFVNFYAGNYATKKASNAVTDLILDSIPVYNVDLIFLYGAVLLWVGVTLILIARPHLTPFTLKCVSIFILIRSVFISLTHIGPSPEQLILPPVNVLAKLTFGGDLFFSGHTGLPFLLALIFWENKMLRYTFLVSSAIFGVVVLLGHLHYSIDVLGAYFITYTIFHIGEKLFKKDRRLFREGIASLLPATTEHH
jgi:hypothetical protein